MILLYLNLRIFQHARSSTRRIQAQQQQQTVSLAGTTKENQPPPKISRRDLRLLFYSIFMFMILVIGWTPIFLLTAIDRDGIVSPLVYTLLQLLAALALFICMLDLFLYNNELRQYFKNKFIICR